MSPAGIPDEDFSDPEEAQVYPAPSLTPPKKQQPGTTPLVLSYTDLLETCTEILNTWDTNFGTLYKAHVEELVQEDHRQHLDLRFEYLADKLIGKSATLPHNRVLIQNLVPKLKD